jgi:hypothetical protein
MRMLLDRAGGLTRVERMKLVTELKRARAGIEAGTLSRIERMRTVMRMKEIRAILGAESGPKADDDPNVAALHEVTAGKHDALSLSGLLDMIDGAVTALNAAGKLAGDIDALAERAIEHWAKLVPVEI